MVVLWAILLATVPNQSNAQLKTKICFLRHNITMKKQIFTQLQFLYAFK